MVTVTELRHAQFNEHHAQTDVVVFNLNPVVGGRVNSSELLVAPRAGKLERLVMMCFFLPWFQFLLAEMFKLKLPLIW